MIKEKRKPFGFLVGPYIPRLKSRVLRPNFNKVFIVRQVTINDQFGPIEIDKRVWDGMKLKQNRKESRK